MPSYLFWPFWVTFWSSRPLSRTRECGQLPMCFCWIWLSATYFWRYSVCHLISFRCWWEILCSDHPCVIFHVTFKVSITCGKNGIYVWIFLQVFFLPIYVRQILSPPKNLFYLFVSGTLRNSRPCIHDLKTRSLKIKSRVFKWGNYYNEESQNHVLRKMKMILNLNEKPIITGEYRCL